MSLATAYLNQTGTLYAAGSAASDGEPSYSTGTSVKCRVEPLSDFIRAQLANTSQATARAFFEPAQTVSAGDRLTVGGTNYTILSVDDRNDVSGNKIIRAAMVAAK